jgi:di/tricarboxylate transporter
VLGIQRHGEPLRQHLADVTFLAGDVLLVQGSNEQLMSLHDTTLLAMLGAVEIPAKRRRKLPTAAMIMLGTILLAAFDVVPILVAALVGVVAMFLTRCLTPEEAYAEVDWMVLVLLGSLIPLGIAMQKTGAAAYVAGSFLLFAAPLGPYGVLFAVYILTSLLTGVISNNAAVLVITPIVIAAATAMGISPMPLIIGAMFAASNSFMTPIGYQTNTFIYGPGGYRFSDFIRVGGLLSVLLAIAATFVIPEFFPF